MAERKDSKGRLLKTGESERKDGRYQYRFKIKGEKNYKTIYSNYLTPSDARGKKEKSLRELEADLENSYSTFGNTQLTLVELIEKYINLKPKLALSTSYNYNKTKDSVVSKHVIGSMSVQSIKKTDVLAFYKYLSDELKYKNSTIQLVHNLIYPTFQMAVDDDMIRKNPCKDCMKDYPQNDAEEKIALTIEQQEIFLKFIETSPLYERYYPMFCIFLETGMRCGEVLGLTWNDINFEDGYIDINHQLQYRKLDGHHQYLITGLKSKASKRQLPINDKIKRAFDLQKQWQWTNGINCLPEKTIEVKGYKEENRSNLVFTSIKGTPFKGNTIDRVLISIVRDYNYSELNISKVKGVKPKLLPHLSVHALRHTACTNWAKAGMDVKVLQYIMGHANIQVTMNVYNHVDLERVKNEAQRMYQLKDEDGNFETSILRIGTMAKSPTIRNRNKVASFM